MAYIDKERFEARIKASPLFKSFGDDGIFIQEFVLALLNKAPQNNNLVEVVKCKECKYWQDNNGGYPHEECRWGKEETPDGDDYCSFGEEGE